MRFPPARQGVQDARMFRLRYLLAAALIAVTASVAAADVTIYRCTDAQGRLTLRDTPCRKGERQQTREMLRPTDPAPRPAAKVAAPATSATPAYSAPPRVVVVNAPRPLYECVTDDGDRYTSDNAEGNLRWVPLAVLGYPMFPRHDGHFRQGLGGRLEVGSGSVRGQVDFGRPLPPPSTHRPPFRPPLLGVDRGYPAGTWIRDACHALPQQEVCDRLRDRRYALDRRYNSALQSERTQISTEQRGIDARLDNDCGVY